ncbi:hypothetical protein [Rhodoplanes elegans]|uniref:hypothetical protein n=1 Tax=Rhodoplanes elegans TaxID=29408 RepID=UPI0014736530|nr:hypothetical protein [Rhodoplanes elegans]
MGHHDEVCDLMAENGRLTANIERQAALIEKLTEALRSLDCMLLASGLCPSVVIQLR